MTGRYLAGRTLQNIEQSPHYTYTTQGSHLTTRTHLHGTLLTKNCNYKKLYLATYSNLIKITVYSAHN